MGIKGGVMLKNLAQPETVNSQHYDFVVVGSGFGSGFFLSKLLETITGRVLVIERGDYNAHSWQVNENRNSSIDRATTYHSDSDKPWNFTIGFGGGTNCWFAQSPRFLPNDFRLKSKYGVGQDWPVSYDELEPYYCDAETIMSVSGDPDMHGIAPRSKPFPQPPHHPSTPDQVMKAARPDTHFIIPTARARVATEGRGPCCASLRCMICPADAKFTAQNGLMDVYNDHRVTVILNSRVTSFDSTNNTVKSASFESAGKTFSVTGDVFVLGANAIHSPAIMQASGMADALTGVGLNETFGADLEILLDGMENFDGSTITTGLDYSFADGDFRADRGAALIYFENRWKFGLRTERSKWRQTLPISIVVEEMLEDGNRVELGENGEPIVHFMGASDYAKKGLQAAIDGLDEILQPLPVEEVVFRRIRRTESHLQSTMRMGSDPASSVVDGDLIHHKYRNLIVVGSSVFPTCGTGNPSLTVAALSLRAAEKLTAKVTI